MPEIYAGFGGHRWCDLSAEHTPNLPNEPPGVGHEQWSTPYPLIPNLLQRIHQRRPAPGSRTEWCWGFDFRPLF
jgi:hypothetical protein